MKITQSKSQISIEFLVVTGILILTLVIMLFFSTVVQKETNKAGKNFELTKECFNLARAISSVYVGGHGTEMRTKTQNTVKVFNTSYDSVKEKGDIKNKTNVLCTFYAKISSDNEVTGNFTIKNKDGIVIVNATA